MLFYELITGINPYSADTPQASLYKQMMEPLPAPSLYIPNLPQSVQGVLLHALELNPAQRYARMEDFAAALHGFASERQSAAQRPLNTSNENTARLGRETVMERTVLEPPYPMSTAGRATLGQSIPPAGSLPPPPAGSLPPPPATAQPRAPQLRAWVALTAVLGMLCIAGFLVLAVPKGINLVRVMMATPSPALSGAGCDGCYSESRRDSESKCSFCSRGYDSSTGFLNAGLYSTWRKNSSKPAACQRRNQCNPDPHCSRGTPYGCPQPPAS